MRRRSTFCRIVTPCAIGLLGIVSSMAAEPAPGPVRKQDAKKIVMIAGPTRHPRGTHEHDKGFALLKSCLETSPNARNLTVEVHSNNWPANPQTLDDADTIVMFNEGWDDHLLAKPDRREKIGRLMRRGVGLVGLHGATAVSDDVEGDFLVWAGGNKKKVVSQHTFTDGQQSVASPDHPVARGVKAFAIHDELYYRYVFCQRYLARAGDKPLVPILTAMLPADKPRREVVAWALQRDDGGRAFMYAGPHNYASWQNESLRRMVLNAILWTAKAEVPEGGVQSTVRDAR